MWIYFIVILSPATLHLIVSCLCLKFPTGWFLEMVKHPQTPLKKPQTSQSKRMNEALNEALFNLGIDEVD